MSGIRFYKMSGTGNDFILIDNMDGSLKTDINRLAATLCRRRFSVGADGLIVLEPSDKADFRWRFHNSDGGEAEMCGNGARCAARLAHRLGIAGQKLSFETMAGIIEAEVFEGTGEVKVRLTNPLDLRRNLHIDVAGGEGVVTHINTGVPHTVELVADVEAVDVDKRGADIRYHQLFKPAGTNADFVQVVDKRNILVRTYERGVEGETLACGTGMVASALIASLGGEVSSPITGKTRGGDTLTVYFDRDGESFKNVYLQGEATFVYQGEIMENV